MEIYCMGASNICLLASVLETVHFAKGSIKTERSSHYMRCSLQLMLRLSCLSRRLRLQKTPSRRLDQDEYVRLSLTSSRRLQDVLVKTNIFVLAIRFQGVFKKFSRRLAKTFARILQKTSCKNIFKTFWRRLQDVFKRSCKDIFKTFSRRIIKLNCFC